MAEKNNAVCSICGNPYYLCMSCRDSIKVNPWKVHCDTAPHYQVYQVIHGYNTNVYTKDEAKDKFKNINLDDMNTFRPHIKKIIEDILKEDKPVVEIVAVETANNESSVESVDIEVVKTEDDAVVKDVENIAKTSYPRKRNYKVEVE